MIKYFCLKLKKALNPSHASLQRFVVRLALLAACMASFALPAQAASVYDNQPPFTRKELSAFLDLLPQFRAWTKTEREDPHPYVNPKGQADFLFSSKAAAWVKSKGWQPKRFFCLMGRAAAALYIVAEGNDMPGNHPKDMPKVSEEELTLARENLSLLLRAGGDAPPLN